MSLSRHERTRVILTLQAQQAMYLAKATAERERMERELDGYDYCFSRGILGIPSAANATHRVTASTWDEDYYRSESGHAKSAGTRRVRALTPVTTNRPKARKSAQRSGRLDQSDVALHTKPIVQGQDS